MICPFATFRRVPNYNAHGNAPRMDIMHIMQGTLVGTDAWFHNPASQVSAHFGIGKTGTLYQWVDTQDVAWHAMAANSHSIGIEHEGNSGQILTFEQIVTHAHLLAWLNKHIPAISIQPCNSVTGTGLAWHGLGGAAWGNHPACPGPPIVAQRGEILQLARLIRAGV